MNLFLYGIMPLVMVYCLLSAPSRKAVVWSVALGLLAYFPVVLMLFGLRFFGLTTNNIERASLFWYHLTHDYAVPSGFFLLVAFGLKWQKMVQWDNFAPVGAFFAAAFGLLLATFAAFGSTYDGMYEFIYRPLAAVSVVVSLSFVVLKPLNPVGWLATFAFMATGGFMAMFVFTINSFMAMLTAGAVLVLLALFWFITRCLMGRKIVEVVAS